MALTQKLILRQSQALVMTPQLMQAIKLLQLSQLDLASYVDGELERNPLLERPAEEEPTRGAEGGSASSTGDDGPAADGDHEIREADHGEIREGDWTELATTREAIESRVDADMDDVFPDDASPAIKRGTEGDAAPPSSWAEVGSGGRGDDDYNLEAFVCAEATLASHLAEQVSLNVPDPVDRIVAQFLVDLVDEAGYIQGDIAEIADKLVIPLARVETVLATLQAFDPPGICARSLAECLAIQLREQDRFDPAMAALVGNLELLARRDIAALRKVCGVDDADLAEMISEIKRLNPKPGLAFSSATVQPIVPDVFVRRGSDGAWLVELNQDTLPKVLVNQTYHARIAKTIANEKDKSYLADCLQTATWLVRALDQRAKTILKVASEIVRQQDGFFVNGIQHLRPLNLKTVAEAISMHELTVSRVTANKYMATARGIFEMKFFFTSAIASADGGEAHSAEAVRHRIKQMIDAEPPDAILSDDTIVEQLRGAGIDIARRTVAKYREAMRIPSSVQRRRDKAAAPV